MRLLKQEQPATWQNELQLSQFLADFVENGLEKPILAADCSLNLCKLLFWHFLRNRICFRNASGIASRLFRRFLRRRNCFRNCFRTVRAFPPETKLLPELLPDFFEISSGAKFLPEYFWNYFSVLIKWTRNREAISELVLNYLFGILN